MGASVDKLTDKAVVVMANLDKKAHGRISGKSNEIDNITSAIRYFETNYKVNYEQTSTVKTGVSNLSARNHHFKSLGHSPDLIGLFFSIFNQIAIYQISVLQHEIKRLFFGAIFFVY